MTETDHEWNEGIKWYKTCKPLTDETYEAHHPAPDSY